jgi:hypothetical protein
MATKPLSPTQLSAIAHARKHNGVLIRQPGGFWVGQYDRENLVSSTGSQTQYFGTRTIESLKALGRMIIDRSTAWPRATVQGI